MYIVEAQDLQLLNYGSSNAKTATLSFYVRSSTTGTYAVSIYASDSNTQIGGTYTINSANTWERKSITFVGNTANAITNDNGAGLQIEWFLAAGSDLTGTVNTSWATFALGRYANGQAVNLMSAVNNNWHITGIQLEVGEQATAFEHRSFGDELAACQRYYYKIAADSAYSTLGTAALSTATVSTIYPFAGFNLRAVPTLESSGVSTFLLQCNNANEAVSSLAINGHASKQVPVCTCNHDSSTAGFAGSLIANNNASAYIAFSSEL